MIKLLNKKTKKQTVYYTILYSLITTIAIDKQMDMSQNKCHFYCNIDI